MRRRGLLNVITGIALVATGCSSNPLPTADDVASSVARVSGTACNRTVEGSAALIADGLYLTNAHIIAGSEPGLKLRLPNAGDVAATVVGFDPNRDLALLAAPEATGRPLVIGSTDAGDKGAIAAVTTDLEVELIEYAVLRRILATGDDIYGEGDVARQALEIEVNIGSGVSGAPLISEDGELIGVVFAESRTKGSSYAVYSSEIESFLAEVDPTTTVASGRCK